MNRERSKRAKPTVNSRFCTVSLYSIVDAQCRRRISRDKREREEGRRKNGRGGSGGVFGEVMNRTLAGELLGRWSLILIARGSSTMILSNGWTPPLEEERFDEDLCPRGIHAALHYLNEDPPKWMGTLRFVLRVLSLREGHDSRATSIYSDIYRYWHSTDVFFSCLLLFILARHLFIRSQIDFMAGPE